MIRTRNELLATQPAAERPTGERILEVGGKGSAGGGGSSVRWARITAVYRDTAPFVYSGVQIVPDEDGEWADKENGDLLNANLFNAAEVDGGGAGKVAVGARVFYWSGLGDYRFCILGGWGTYG